MAVIDRALDSVLPVTQPGTLDVRGPELGLGSGSGNKELPTGRRIRIVTNESPGGPSGRLQTVFE
jgi:hypothetical protein